MKYYEGPCPIEKVLNVFSGKWKPSIIYHLEHEEVLRFGELTRIIPEVTQRMLTQQLRELERDGIIERKSYDEKIRRVEYRLTALGLTFRSIATELEKWGQSHMSSVKKARDAFDAVQSL